MAVLKSDNANGLFGFDGPCQPPVVPMSVNELNCTVRRDRGSYDVATVVWQTASVDASVSASQYFINYTGLVLFADEQTVAVSSTIEIFILYVYIFSYCSGRFMDG